jgi:O-antigen ligase
LSSQWAVISAQIALDAIWEVAKTVIVVTLFVRVIRTEKHMSTVMMACIAGVAHAGFLHVFGTRWGYVNPALARGDGVLPDAQNGVLVLFVPLIVLLAMFGSKKEKILSWCALPLVLDSIVNTYERTGFSALIVEFFLIFLFVPRRQKRQLIPVMAVGLGLLVFRFTPDDYWAKMVTIANPHEEASAESRFVVNDASRRMFLEHPMGVGYRNYPMTSPRYLGAGYLTKASDGELVRSAHNSYYTVLCETGIIGFGFWITAFAGTILMLRKIRKRAGDTLGTIEVYATALEIGLYGWAIGGWVQSYHEVDPAYWFVGFAVVLYRLQHQQFQEIESFDVNESMENPQPSLAG